MTKEKIYSQPTSSSKNSPMQEKEYLQFYKESLENPELFWTKQSKEYLEWDSSWNQLNRSNFLKGECEWFLGGKLNASINCIDRHLKEKSFETAIIWEGDEPKESKKITYLELYHAVGKFSNALKKRGVRKGDVVCIYMPMILKQHMQCLHVQELVQFIRWFLEDFLLKH